MQDPAALNALSKFNIQILNAELLKDQPSDPEVDEIMKALEKVPRLPFGGEEPIMDMPSC